MNYPICILNHHILLPYLTSTIPIRTFDVRRAQSQSTTIQKLVWSLVKFGTDICNDYCYLPRLGSPCYPTFSSTSLLFKILYPNYVYTHACYFAGWILSPLMRRIWIPSFPFSLPLNFKSVAYVIDKCSQFCDFDLVLAIFVNNYFHPFCTVSWYWCAEICHLYRRDRPNLSCILRDIFIIITGRSLLMICM